MIGRLLMMATGLLTALWPRRAARRGSSPPGTRIRAWPPRPGDRVEFFSRYYHAWFPAVVERSEPSRAGGWPLIAVRLLGNAVSDDGAREDELRPLDWLAAAVRDPNRFPETCPAWSAYDTHAAEHMDGCLGCPECEGLDEHYPACPGCGSRRLRLADDLCICSKHPHLRKLSAAKARKAMAWRRAARRHHVPI